MIFKFNALPVALLLLLWGVLPASAGPFEDGFAAAKSEDYQTALRLWMPLERQGDAKAQFGLGGAYDAGDGVPQNYTEAMKSYRLAADIPKWQDIARWRQLEKGMLKYEVRELLGEPTRITDLGTLVFWYYGRGQAYVAFNPNGSIYGFSEP